MNIERLKGWNRTKPKSVSGIQRSIFRISLQQSKSYLRLLQCVTPLVKLVTACVSSCASRGETESQGAPLILWFAVPWLFPRNGTLSAGSTPGWEGELPPAIPVLPHSPQISFLSSPPLLCSAAVDPCHCHGPWPLEFNIPAHPCIYLEFNTQITPLFFIWFSCFELEVNSQGRSKSDLRSPDIPSWACSGISTRLHCINTWKKPRFDWDLFSSVGEG